jgi:GNAT superfamily N-acetyltransferase
MAVPRRADGPRYHGVMSDVWVRDATELDLPTLVELIVAEGHEAEGRSLDAEVVCASVTAAMRDPALARYWFAGTGSTVLGAIGVVREWSDWQNAAYWWIQFVFVVSDARGRGLLARLVDRVKHAAAAAAAPELRLYVHRDNARARRAYERIGFAGSEYMIMTQPIARGPASAAVALDDDDLWRAFHDRTLPAAQWTHAAHLRVAWLHLARHELDEAHLRMRAGIIRLNAAHGLIETPQRGYHETLTRVWLVLVRAARRRAIGNDSTSVVSQPGLARTAPLEFYRHDRLFSIEARATFVPPDLAELP